MSEFENKGYSGGCTCGLVRYILTRDPMFVHCCHCTWCQKETGAAFAVNAIIESEFVELTKGTPIIVDTPSYSGEGQKILRCPDCQMALWSYYSGSGELVSFIRVGTLDEPSDFSPDIHIYTSTKLPWVNLTGEIPVVSEYYDFKEYWPEESIKRREAVFNKLKNQR